MFKVNPRLPRRERPLHRPGRLLWLLLGALLPLLFLLEWAVDRSGRRDHTVEAELSVRLDQGDPHTLALPLEAWHQDDGLTLKGTGRLQGARYPWKATPIEATTELRLSDGFLADPSNGVRNEGFVASLVLRDTSRADGLGMPRIPCTGAILVEKMELVNDNLSQLRLRLDLACTSSGPDLKWGSGDERTWGLVGPVQLRIKSG